MTAILITACTLLFASLAVVAFAIFGQRRAIAAARPQVLSVLEDGPGTGLDITDRVQERFGAAHYSVVVTALRALEREGRLESWEDMSSGGPRRMYKLAGRK